MATDEETAGKTTKEEQEPSYRPQTFKKGNKLAAGPSKSKGAVANNPSQLLRDMRWVWEHKKDRDKTLSHKTLRGMMERDTRGFLAQMAKLEMEHKRASLELRLARKKFEAEERGVGAGADEGSERAGEMIGRLLQEFHDGRDQGKTSANGTE